MSTDRLYVRADLEDYADLDRIHDDPDSWGNPSRLELLEQSLGLDEFDIKSARAGSYQGQMLFIFRTAGYIWLLKDSYGSCSHCDGLLAADHASEYAETMMRDAYAFTSIEDVREFIEAKIDGDEYGIYKWEELADEVLDVLDVV
jgi:hypothetical protein